MPHVFDHTPTAQEVFDAACKFFATTPGPSVKPRPGSLGEWNCVYRGDGGKPCVAGYFIPDEVYLPEMDEPALFDDGTTIDKLVGRYPGKLPAWMTTHSDLLRSLQKIHDDQWNWILDASGWHYSRVAEQLADLAGDYHLDTKAAQAVGDKDLKPSSTRIGDDELLAALSEDKPNWSEVPT